MMRFAEGCERWRQSGDASAIAVSVFCSPARGYT
jgi:hypothetical protein